MKRFAGAVSLCVVVFAAARAGAATPIRVDISPQNDRRDHLTSEWHNWLIPPDGPAEMSVGALKISLKPLNAGARLRADWWKPGLVHDATMACDGVTSSDQGGLKLVIRGLKPGKHSLVTFHNEIGEAAGGPLEVGMLGDSTRVAVRSTHRVLEDADVASGYLEFDAGGDEVAIAIRPVTPEQGVIVNGFEIDVTDPTKQARKPSPAHADEHAAERPTIAWQPARDATAHDVYLGADAAAVENATPQSPEYRGRQSSTTFASDAGDSFTTYYWRVDEVDAKNQVTKGDVWRFRVRHLAFPGAEGYGRFARGGRGGRVLHVTNLDDGGPGSLRDAIEAEGPRTIVFDISGRIDLKNRMAIRNPYLTIAGQTAPGKGICISNLNLGMLGAHDVIVRYIRVRPGDTSGLTLDGMGMASSDHSIIDHCSISWTQDEAFSSRAARNITLQRTLISEALNVAGHKNYKPGTQHGYAASIGGDVGSFHHNLLAHCAGRNWSLAGGLDKAGRHAGRLDIRNNVVYNWGHRTTDGGAQQVNYVNNYYKPGPASRVFHVLMPERKNVKAFGPQEYFVAGNVMVGRYGADETRAGVVSPNDEPIESFVVAAPFFEPYVTTQSAEQAYGSVLADVGCNVPMLDEHDRRVIAETRHGTTTFKGSVSGLPGLPDSQKDVGGWEEYPEEHRTADWDVDGDGMPGAWEREHGLDPNNPADGNRDADGDGYTNLEAFLNGLARTN